MPYLKNRGPLLVDRVKGYFDRLPPWLRESIPIRVEKQKVDAKIDELDPTALDSELKQEVTDEKLLTNKFLGAGAVGSGNDLTGTLPASNLSEVVIRETGQVANVTETVAGSEMHLVEGPPLQDGTSEQVGDLWVKKEVTASTFDDKVFQLQREDLIPPEFRALVPEKLEAHTVDGTAALPTLGAGELLRREEQSKVGVKKVSVQSRDLTTPPTLGGQKNDPQWNGATLDLEQKIVPAGTTISQVFGVTDVTIKPIDGTNALQETWTASGGFPQIFLRKFDPEIGQEIVENVQIVANGAVYVPDANDLDYEDRQIDALHVQRRTERAYTIPSIVTFTTQMITFPGILTYISFSLVALGAANRREPQWVAGIRAPFTVPTQIQNNTEFFRTPPDPLSVYSWAPTDVIFKGISYSISLSNVLVDTWSAIGVAYTSDAYYGNAVDRFSISATSPSATAYVNNIGNYAAISSVVDRYKNLWVRKTSFIQLR